MPHNLFLWHQSNASKSNFAVENIDCYSLNFNIIVKTGWLGVEAFSRMMVQVSKMQNTMISKVVNSFKTQSALPEGLQSAKDGWTCPGKWSPTGHIKNMARKLFVGTDACFLLLCFILIMLQAGVERLLGGWNVGPVDQLEANLYRWSVGETDDL